MFVTRPFMEGSEGKERESKKRIFFFFPQDIFSESMKYSSAVTITLLPVRSCSRSCCSSISLSVSRQQLPCRARICSPLPHSTVGTVKNATLRGLEQDYARGLPLFSEPHAGGWW